MEDREEKLKYQLDLLIEEGKPFSSGAVLTVDRRGFITDVNAEWASWFHRVRKVILGNFGSRSAPRDTFSIGSKIQFIGYGVDKYQSMMGYVLNALQKAREVVEKDIFEELVDASVAKTSPTYSNKVFIVHGHDDAAKQELEMFLAELGLEPIVLHRKADKGRTLIEKLEQEGDVGYAFILLTPDDIGYKADQEALPDEDREKERRARQNVVLEFGYFAGHLGRERVCCLHKGNVALPSDTDGLAYKPFINSIEELKWKIAAELIAAGYDIEIPKKE